MMNVQELIEQLQAVDGTRRVILSSDAEGNGHSPLADISEGAYLAETTYSGETYLERLTPELEAKGYGPEDVAEDGLPAVILHPIN